MVAATPVYTVRQPALATGKGTIRLQSEDAAGIPDDELGDLQRRTQGPDCLAGSCRAGGQPARRSVAPAEYAMAAQPCHRICRVHR